MAKSNKRNHMRRYARELPKDESRKTIVHVRDLKDGLITDRYETYYAILLGVYRAELARRNAGES